MSVDRRRDNRTIRQFAEDIKKWTRAEGRIAKLVYEDLKMRGIDCRGFVDAGVDNSGEFIDGPLESNEADFKFFFGFGMVPIEMKVANPKEDTYQTFKVNDIIKAVKNEGSILCYSKNWYYIIPTRTCSHLIENFPQKIYRYLSDTDMAIRINSVHHAKKKNMTEKERGPKLWEEFLHDSRQRSAASPIRKFCWRTEALRLAASEVIEEAKSRKSLSRA